MVLQRTVKELSTYRQFSKECQTKIRSLCYNKPHPLELPSVPGMCISIRKTVDKQTCNFTKSGISNFKKQ